MITKKEQAFHFFSRDPVLYVSLSEPLRLGRAQVVACSDMGVLLCHDTDLLMLAAESMEAAEPLLAAWNRPMQEITVVGTTLTDDLMDRMQLQMSSRCYQAVYCKEERLPVHADIRQLDLSYFQAVLEGYSLFQDPDYVDNRLRSGVVYGAFVDGTLAGFVGEHREGSMGMLEVFPAYRGRGLAVALESFQINRYLSEGRVPFDQVILGNEISMGLKLKLGLELSQETVAWLLADDVA